MTMEPSYLDHHRCNRNYSVNLTSQWPLTLSTNDCLSETIQLLETDWLSFELNSNRDVPFSALIGIQNIETNDKTNSCDFQLYSQSPQIQDNNSNYFTYPVNHGEQQTTPSQFQYENQNTPPITEPWFPLTMESRIITPQFSALPETDHSLFNESLPLQNMPIPIPSLLSVNISHSGESTLTMWAFE